MREIGVLKDDDVVGQSEVIDRTVIRGIARNKNKYLMIYSSTFRNYFFPGGGMKCKETNKDCLLREVQEETGMLVGSIKGAVGYIDEIRQHHFDSRPFIQRTCYYKCDVSGGGTKHLEEHEKNYEVRWVTLDEALEANMKISNKPYFIVREIMIINELKKEKNYARISNS